jgi:hypothetical protein
MLVVFKLIVNIVGGFVSRNKSNIVWDMYLLREVLDVQATVYDLPFFFAILVKSYKPRSGDSINNTLWQLE